MSERTDEDVLEAEYRRLRVETEASGLHPDFVSMIARARADASATAGVRAEAGGRSGATPRRRPRALVVGGWATAAAVAAVLLMRDRPDADLEFERLVAAYTADAASGAWRSPTSGLLDVPGMGLTRSVPTFGGAARGLNPSTRPVRGEPGPPGGRDS